MKLEKKLFTLPTNLAYLRSQEAFSLPTLFPASCVSADNLSDMQQQCPCTC